METKIIGVLEELKQIFSAGNDPSMRPAQERIVSILRSLLQISPTRCGEIIDILALDTDGASRYLDGLLYCLRDRPELSDEQWRKVERWLAQAFQGAIAAGAAAPGIDRTQALDLAARLQTWRWNTELTPEAMTARYGAQQVSLAGLIWALATKAEGVSRLQDAQGFARSLFDLKAGSLAVECLQMQAVHLETSEREPFEDIARRYGAFIFETPDVQSSVAPSAIEDCEAETSAGEPAAALVSLSRYLVEPTIDSKRLSDVLLAFMRANPTQCGALIDVLIPHPESASGAINGLLYALRDKPPLSDIQWNEVEAWLKAALVTAMGDSGTLDRAQAFDLVLRLKFWRPGRIGAIAQLTSTAAQLALSDLTRLLVLPRRERFLDDASEAAKRMVDLGHGDRLEAYLGAPPAEIDDTLWLRLAGIGSAAGKAQARVLMLSKLAAEPGSREAALGLAQNAPDKFDKDIAAALAKAIEHGVSAVEIARAWISGLIMRGALGEALTATQALAAPLGLSGTAHIGDLSGCIQQSPLLREALTIDAYRALYIDYMRNSMAPQARQVLAAWVEKMPDDPGLSVDLAEAHIAQGEPNLALDILLAGEGRFPETPQRLLAFAEAFSALGRRDDLRQTLIHLKSLEEAQGDTGVVARIDWLQIQIDAGDFLERIPVSAPLKGVAAIVTARSPLIIMWSTIAACELRKRGYETVFVDAPAALGGSFSAPEIAALHGLVTPHGLSFRKEAPVLTPHPDWEEDINERSLKRAGYDIYQAVFERITSVQQRYQTLPGPEADAVRLNALLRADVAIRACETIAEYARNTGQKIIFLGTMMHYSPGCIYRQFAQQALPGVAADYVEVNVGYEAYKSNDLTSKAYSISAGNLTKNLDQRSSIHTNRRSFERWLARHAETESGASEVDQILSADRARRTPSAEAEALRLRMIETRKRGGPIVVVMGKITFDISIEREGGPAHRDMTDWLNHSIEAVRNHPDTLMLIKPHPYEIVPEIARPNEFFAELIAGELPDNCVVLGHRWFNLADLMPLVDLISIWHGTATLEALSQGVPVIVSATCGMIDHPIEVITPSNRAHYAELLTTADLPAVSDETRQRARKLIEYLVSEEVIVPYPYANAFALRPNGDRRWGWNKEEVERYLSEGDRYMAYLADICEFGDADLMPPAGE